jgi:DNA polymerase III alpha subunit (gram-positive type)
VLPPGSEFINHNPNLKKIQYYAVLEIEVNKSDKELRVDEIIELSFLLVQDSEVLFKKHWYIKPTVFHNVFPQTTDRTGIVIEYLKEKPKIEEVLSNIEA